MSGNFDFILRPEILAALVPLGIAYAGYTLWVLFLAVMNLARVHQLGQLSKSIFYLSLPLLVVAFAVDITINIVLGTVVFLQLPHYKRLTLSARMDDLIRNGSGWRKRFAIWFVGTLLQPFDQTGQHTTYGN